MRSLCKFLFSSLAICGYPLAHALDPSAQVQSALILRTTTSWDGQAIVYPEGKPEVTSMLIEIGPHGETGWHLHPVPSFAWMIEGELEIQLKNGGIKYLKAGDALAEVANTWHNGRNVGTAPVKLVVFYAGAVGQTLTLRENAP